MSRHKGKAQRRSKSWDQLYKAGEEIEDVASAPQKYSVRGVKIPSWRAEALEDNLDDLPRREGLVVGLFPGGVIVRSDKGEMLCGVAKTFRAPEGSSVLAVGDLVTVAETHAHHADRSEGDKDRADGMILSRKLRRTVLSRPAPRSGKHRDAYQAEAPDKVIAANADVLLIVSATVQPAFRQNLLDRFLIIAERGELKPVLVLNKVDLSPAPPDVLVECGAMGLEIYCCSAASGEGIAALRERLVGRSSVLAGASGVGKSTLVNAMIPGAEAITRDIRMRDQRGRHTTSAATVYDMPGGGVLIDTPGVRELGMGMKAGELPWYYPEFEPLAPLCKFRDCTHTHEPHCAVVAAAEEGKISPRRYLSYLRILETLDDK